MKLSDRRANQGIRTPPQGSRWDFQGVSIRKKGAGGLQDAGYWIAPVDLNQELPEDRLSFRGISPGGLGQVSMR